MTSPNVTHTPHALTHPPSFIKTHRNELITTIALGILLAGGLLLYLNIHTLAGWGLLAGGWSVAAAGLIIHALISICRSKERELNEGDIHLTPRAASNLSSGGSSLGYQPAKGFSDRLSGVASSAQLTRPAVLRMTRMECAKRVLAKTFEVDISQVSISIPRCTENASEKEISFYDSESKLSLPLDPYDAVEFVRNKLKNILDAKEERFFKISYKIKEETLETAIEKYTLKKLEEKNLREQNHLEKLRGKRDTSIYINGRKKKEVQFEKDKIKTIEDLCFVISKTLGQTHFWLDNSPLPTIIYDGLRREVLDINSKQLISGQLITEVLNNNREIITGTPIPEDIFENFTCDVKSSIYHYNYIDQRYECSTF